ncbi:hypothetical protein GQ53DRAFT_130982 [Thozetella sp. PMI_491]|nr:hypothetical protein GQ53DRAFT_130982 [Thozetella sp. PMI_491]
MIPSISDPWGCIDTDMFEEGLLRAVQLCRHYGDWDAFGRLKALWREIHRWASTENPDEVLNHERSMP